MSYKTILTEVDGKVATITLNRPEVLNALNDQLMEELGAALLAFDADDNIGCMITLVVKKHLLRARISLPWRNMA